MPSPCAQDLSILGLSPLDLENLSADDQSQKIRKQWYKLCLKYHPDRHPGYTDQFNKITAAYDRLIANFSYYQHDITRYFISQNIHIPDTALDVTQQEGINQSYEKLLSKFSSLPSEPVKQKFAQYYAPFLNLAMSLEKQQKELNHKKAANFIKQMQETFSQRFIREWRLLVLRIFAEEYLDDFLYRHALGTGTIWPILATRKLLNPLKQLICMVNSLLLLGIHSGDYLLKIVILRFFQEFYEVYNNPNRNWYAIVKITVKLITLSTILALPFYIMPLMSFYLMSLSFLQRCLETIASPISQYIRPCSKRLSCSEKTLSIASFIGISIVLVWCASHISMLWASLHIILNLLNILTSLYFLFSLAKMVKLLYQQQPASAVFLVMLILGSTLFQLIFPLPVENDITPTLTNLFGEFLMNLSSCATIEIANSQLADTSAYLGELMEILPLPEEPIDPRLRTACLLGYNKAKWSQRLFNTPEGAISIGLEEARKTNNIWACLWGKEQPTEIMPSFVMSPQLK